MYILPIFKKGTHPSLSEGGVSCHQQGFKGGTTENWLPINWQWRGGGGNLNLKNITEPVYRIG